MFLLDIYIYELFSTAKYYSSGMRVVNYKSSHVDSFRTMNQHTKSNKRANGIDTSSNL